MLCFRQFWCGLDPVILLSGAGVAAIAVAAGILEMLKRLIEKKGQDSGLSAFIGDLKLIGFLRCKQGIGQINGIGGNLAIARIGDILPDTIVCAKPDAYLRRITGQTCDRETELAACRKNAVDIRMFRILYGNRHTQHRDSERLGKSGMSRGGQGAGQPVKAGCRGINGVRIPADICLIQSIGCIIAAPEPGQVCTYESRQITSGRDGVGFSFGGPRIDLCQNDRTVREHDMDRKPQRAQYMICACITVWEDDRSELFVFAGDRNIDLRQIEPSDIPVNGKPDGCLFTISRTHAGTDRLQLQDTHQQCVIVFTRVLHDDDRIESGERIRIQNFKNCAGFYFRCLACFRCACYFRCFRRFGLCFSLR